VLWSIIWPITPFCAVLNNWLELRSDAAKICMSFRRPVPQRTDSIGPWFRNISFLSWLGSLTTSTIVYLFQGGDFSLECDRNTLIHLLVTILIAEHGYWICDRAIAALSHRVRTAGEIKVRQEEYSVRRRYLQNIGLSGGEEITGLTDVQEQKLQGGGDQIGFWKRQGVESAVSDGRELLSLGWQKRKSQ